MSGSHEPPAPRGSEPVAPTDRRRLLTTGAAVLSGVALGVVPGLPSAAAAGERSPAEECARPSRGFNAGYLPNVVVTAHDGSRALFYDDLIAGKTVLLHCTSVAREAVYPLIANLVEVQRLLGGRMGRDVRFYTLTVDPENDTPRALAELALRYGVGPGWWLLTGEPDDLSLVRSRLYAHQGGHLHGGTGASPGAPQPARDCSLGLARYGNEALGLWGSVPTRADPAWIARRLDWVLPGRTPAGAPRRRGPTPTTYRT
jgi:protein SCO1